MTTRPLITKEDAQRWADLIVGLPLPVTVTWREGVLPSDSQRGLVHQWFKDIADHFGDRSAREVKGLCNVTYGLPIRLRDPVFCWVWKRSGDGLSPEKQQALLSVGNEVFRITSAMTKPELREYMTEMSEDYRAQGVRLTDPELRKWEGAA